MSNQTLYRRQQRLRHGVSILEMTVTLVIIVAVLTVSLLLLHNITDRTRSVGERMAAEAIIQHCLTQIVQEVTTAGREANISVEQDVRGGQTASRLTIVFEAGKATKTVVHRIDWVAAPRLEQQDMVLFRREMRHTDRERALFIPLCESLHCFRVDLLDRQGKLFHDPNDTPRMVELTAQVYQFGPAYPEQLLTARRTFCLRRF